MKKNVLVVSAHAADFVWRCSGTIANYAKAGNTVKIIALSYGARGESDEVWRRNPGITEQEVREIRHKEAENVAAYLGAQIDFYGWDDHLIVIDRDRMLRLAADMKDYQPDIILSHSKSDPLNADHNNVHRAVMEAMRSANVPGVFPEKKEMKRRNFFMYEPNEADISEFHPNTYIDITDSMDIKRKAMELMESQNYLAPSYILRAEYRGMQAKKALGKPVKYAEAFMSLMPYVGTEFHI